MQFANERTVHFVLHICRFVFLFRSFLSTSTMTDVGVLNRLVRTFSGQGTNASTQSPTVQLVEPTPEVNEPVGEPIEEPSPPEPEPVLVSEPSTAQSMARKVSVLGKLKRIAKNPLKKDKVSLSASGGKDPSTGPPPGEDADPELEFPDDPEIDLSEPSQLAKRIRDIIDALPTPSGSPGKVPIPKKPTIPAKDKSGRPVPPNAVNRIKDGKLISLLSSATIMNGSTEGDRISVWSILDSLGPPHHAPAEGETEPTDGQPSEGSGDDGSSHVSDDSSIMMYSPLIPLKDSVVEFAETQYVSIPSALAAGAQDTVQVLSWWPKVWPFNRWGGSAEPTQPPAQETPAKPPPTQVKVWVPSKTKLSFQVMWWGYRVYLPPPVLDILSDKTIEATKRAAMITTALTWFFSNLPVSSLPLPIQPAVLMLQKIVPYLGYMGTFISWSWSTIKGYDVGWYPLF